MPQPLPRQNRPHRRRPQSRPEAPGSGPLAGLRVVDLTDDHPGALTTMFLADYGAEVIKVIPRGGIPSEQAPQYMVWNRNKRAVAVDLVQRRRGRGSARVLELLGGADVLVESLGPGTAESLGLGWQVCRAHNPSLIYCSITPYGQDGPLARHLGYEGLVQAVTGVMTEQRGPDGSPVYNALPLVGIGTALLAIHGILAAVHHRQETGRGQRVDTSMYQGSIAARSPMLVRGQGVQTWDSAGNDPQGALPNYRLYRCADGKWLHLGTLIPVFWNKLIIVLELYAFAIDPRFETAPLYWPTEEIRAEAKKILAAKFASAPRDHWLKVLREGDVPASPATPTYDLFEHPQVIANGLAASIEDPRVGRLAQVMPPVAMSRTPGALRRPAPAAPERQIEWGSNARFFDPLTSIRSSWGTGKVGAVQVQRHPLSPSGEGEGGAKQLVSPSHEGTARRGGGSKGPLEGVRVLDLSSYLAGPIGPAYLADLGADVIKVEPPAGEGCRMIMMLFLGGNLSKRDLALDLKHPASQDVLRRLIERSDVVVHNNRIGVAERLGLDYASVQKIRPDVIYLQSTAYGSRGPDATLPGFDPLFQSFTGIGIAQAGPGNPPVFPKTPICDIATAMLGTAAVLLALAHRNRTGEGQLVETSLLATGLWLKSDWFVRHDGWQPPRVTNSDNSGLSPVYRWYGTADGWIFAGCRTPQEVKSFLAVTCAGEPHVPGTTDEDVLTKLLASKIAAHSTSDWLELFRAAGVPAELVAQNNDEGVYANPQAAHLRALEYHPYPGFTDLRQPGILVHFSETPAIRRSGSPTCGQDTVEVMSELGYSPSEIAGFERDRVVAIYRGE